jgi:hypothetical protein
LHTCLGELDASYLAAHLPQSIGTWVRARSD